MLRKGTLWLNNETGKGVIILAIVKKKNIGNTVIYCNEDDEFNWATEKIFLKRNQRVTKPKQ